MCIRDRCKHVAAVLYGIGARFDSKPELLFTLRQVDPAELLSKAGRGVVTAPVAGERTLADDDIGALFGLEMDGSDVYKRQVRRGDLDEHRLELPAVLPIGDPAAGGGGVLAGGDARRVTHQRDQLTLSPDLEPQHAKTTVGVVKRDSLDEAGELLE